MALAAIGNPHRFENRAQLIRLAVFDLSASRSGEKSKTAVPVISKKGKRTCVRVVPGGVGRLQFNQPLPGLL